MLGFTKQEQGIVLFLIFSLLVGVSVQLYNRFFHETSLVEIKQAFVDKLNAKFEKMNTLQEAGAVPEKNIVVRETSALLSKDVSVKTQATGQDLPENHANEFALIDINSSNEEALQLIPRIGPVLAQRIIRFRQKNGQFGRIEELKQVKGIGKATLKKIVPYISINRNGSD